MDWCKEFMWFVALCTLHRAFAMARCLRDGKGKHLKWWPPVAESNILAEDQHGAVTLPSQKEEGATPPPGPPSLSDAARDDLIKEQYESMVRAYARSLPALAVSSPVSSSARTAPPLRKNVLKRQMARAIIKHGIDTLHDEVARDSCGDPRASLALADFHAVQEQLDDDHSGASNGFMARPSWKRLCRVVNFLRRNADAAPTPQGVEARCTV